MKLQSKDMKRIFNMPFEDFAQYGEILEFEVTKKGYSNFYKGAMKYVPDYTEKRRYIFKDNGSKVLAVAHLDTVHGSDKFTRVAALGQDFVLSTKLDDRLGAYIILEVLPKMGIVCDWLLTEGEESCSSTASLFVPTKEYNWAFEFDRGGTDTVLYQYDDKETAKLVTDYGWDAGWGTYSDIADLDIGVKCFNFGTGYYNNHSKKSYANLNETRESIEKFARFYQDLKDKRLPHEYVPYERYVYGGMNWELDGFRLPTLEGDKFDQCSVCQLWFDTNALIEGMCEECASYVYDDLPRKKGVWYIHCTECGSPYDADKDVDGTCPDCAGWVKQRDMYIDCPNCNYPILREEWDEISGRCVFCIHAPDDAKYLSPRAAIGAELAR